MSQGQLGAEAASKTSQSQDTAALDTAANQSQGKLHQLQLKLGTKVAAERSLDFASTTLADVYAIVADELGVAPAASSTASSVTLLYRGRKLRGVAFEPLDKTTLAEVCARDLKAATSTDKPVAVVFALLGPGLKVAEANRKALDEVETTLQTGQVEVYQTGGAGSGKTVPLDALELTRLSELLDSLVDVHGALREKRKALLLKIEEVEKSL